MTTPNIDKDLPFLDYLNLQVPENIVGQEALLYEIFFRKFTFRRIDHLNSLKEADAFVEWPKGCFLHDIYQNFLMNKPVELVPDMTSAPLRRNPKRKFVMHITEPVEPKIIPYAETFILPPKGLITTILNFKKRNQKFCRPITDITKFPPAKRGEVLSVISYESLYRARILGLMKQYRRFNYVWTVILNTIAKLPDRDHFIPIPVGSTTYERSDFIMSFKRYDKATIRHPDDPWYLFMMHFMGFMHCESTSSIFEKIPKALLSKINFVLFSKSSIMVYNLEKLKSFNTEHDTILLRFLNQLNELALDGFSVEENIDYGDKEVVYDVIEDATELKVEDNSEFEEDNFIKPFSVTQGGNLGQNTQSVSLPITPEKEEPKQEEINLAEAKKKEDLEKNIKKMEEAHVNLVKLASPSADTSVNTVSLKSPSSAVNPVKEESAPAPTVKPSIVQSKVEAEMDKVKDDFKDIDITPKYVEIDESLLEVKSDNNLNIPMFKEEKSHKELIESKKKFVEKIEKTTEEFIQNTENITPAQRQRAVKMSTVWKDLKSSTGKTLKEVIEDVPDESINKDTITCLENDPDIMDKSMLESCNKTFDVDYMKNMFEHDFVSNLLTFSKVGMFLKDYKIEDISDSLNDLQRVSIKFEDVHHKEHSFHFNIPKVNDKGFIKLNGTQKVLKKQRIDMPLCKVSPTLVRLCSDNNKYRVIRNENTAHSFLPYIGRLLRKGDQSCISTEFARITLNNVKLPYEYTTMASKYRSISINISRKVQMFFDYEQRWTWLRGLEISEDDIKKIKTNETKLQGVLFGVDEYGTEYYMRLDGSTVLIDNKGELIRTSFIDVLCDELEVDMPPLSEWVDMNLLGKEMIVPIIIVLGYQFGLSHMLEYTKTKYVVLNKNERMQRNWSDIVIRFKDKTLIIPRYPLINSLIFAGLNNYDLKDVLMEDMDSKDIYYELMRSKGKSIHLLKGIDNYFDLFMDSVTYDILEQMGEPTDCKDLLIRAVQLLSTEDHKAPASATNFRFRSYERINASIYKTLAISFATYRAKGVGATHKWSFPDYEVMKMITEDQLLENVDTINPINEIKYYAEYSHSGVGGRKSVDTFMVPDRQFDPDAVGTMSEATVDNSKTGFAASVSMNPIFSNLRGMVIPKQAQDLKPTQMLSVTGVLVPFGTNDDGKRSNFSSIHSSHYVGVNKMDINRARTGFDKVVAHRVGYPFAQAAKDDGTIVFHDEAKKLIKVKYKSGEIEAFKYGEEYTNNGGGGFYCTQEMQNNDFKMGDKVKKGDIVTYNDKFFGKDLNSKQVIWKFGRLSTTAFIEADGTLDDANMISGDVARDLGFQPCHIRDVNLDVTTNVHMYAKVGTFVKNIDPILIYDQAAMDDDMFGKLDGDAVKLLTKLNRSTPKARFSGTVVKIEAYYKCALSDMSTSMRKLVSIINKDIEDTQKQVADASNKDNFQKTSNIKYSDRLGLNDIDEHNIILRFYIQQKMGVNPGDKLEWGGSSKSVCSQVVEEGWKTEDGTQVDSLFSAIGINNRIVLSPIRMGLVNTVMKELETQIVDEYYS